MTKWDVDTPALIVDLDVMEENIARMAVSRCINAMIDVV